jgi:WD40 repeat protein
VKIDINAQKVHNIEINYVTDFEPKVIKVHPRMDNCIAIGLTNGSVLFFDQKTNKTFTLAGLQRPVSSDEETKDGKVFWGVEDMSWDPFEENLLVAYEAGIALVSFQGFSSHTSIKQVFQTKNISSLFWTDDKSGNFVTANDILGTITLWNAANSEPRKSFKVGNTGIRYILPINGDHNRVLIAFKNGALTLFNLERKQTEFQTEAGHSETIFDLKYHPTQESLLASCSYDGTVRIWDTSTMKLIVVNDTNRATPQAEKKIIYSCSWHPKLTKVAISTVNGCLMIYDALKGKLLSSIAPRPGSLSFCVSWNTQNS